MPEAFFTIQRQFEVFKYPRCSVFRILTIAACLFLHSACTKVSRPVEVREQKAATTATLEWLSERYGFVDSLLSASYLQSITARLNTGSSRADDLCASSFSLGRQESSVPESDPERNAEENWSVLLLKDDTPNAFSLGSRTIVISTGLISNLGSESELAAILSHEMSHEYLGHANEKDSLSNREPLALLSLEQEIDADAYGLCLLQAARYSSTGAILSLSIGYRQESGNVSTEDWLARRLEALQQKILQLPSVVAPTPNLRRFRRFQRDLGIQSDFK